MPGIGSNFFEQPLRDVAVQEILLELMRRSSFNAFDGKQVVTDLLAVQHLWQGVLLDRPTYYTVDDRRINGLIKLRDLRYNIWNADTLFVLCENEANAHALMLLIEERDWGGEVKLVSNREDVDYALGSGRTQQVYLEIWWD